ncbi:glycosyl hydrolase [Aspergillus lucknowensis]|uniref:Glycosyl hydrolase n=1 Tax=Aspergillus lucknowensis TaxID=176173 RepID=A0ABR4M2W1_9EURO
MLDSVSHQPLSGSVNSKDNEARRLSTNTLSNLFLFNSKAMKFTLLLTLLGAVASQLQEAPARPSGAYTEPYRPRYHFSPKKNWMNDPNSLIYNNGTCHLYFQHNPGGDTRGAMSWGHATSRDLTHWTECLVALQAR